MATTVKWTQCGRLNPCFNGIWSRTTHRGEAEKLIACAVLILVLMEYGLGPCRCHYLCRHFECVLILVLMEYGLGGLATMWHPARLSSSLNPCFNGIWSRTTKEVRMYEGKYEGLNPCFNGIWSRTAKTINNCYSALWLSFRDRNGQF